jgi:hypothetical protein
MKRYPLWVSTRSGEDYDRIAALALQFTDRDRDRGDDAPAHGYSAANWNRAERIVKRSNRYDSVRCAYVSAVGR